MIPDRLFAVIPGRAQRGPGIHRAVGVMLWIPGSRVPRAPE